MFEYLRGGPVGAVLGIVGFGEVERPNDSFGRPSLFDAGVWLLTPFTSLSVGLLVMASTSLKGFR